MNNSEVINEILYEWAWRCPSGYPNLKSATDINILSEVLHEFGCELDLHNQIIEHLTTQVVLTEVTPKIGVPYKTTSGKWRAKKSENDPGQSFDSKTAADRYLKSDDYNPEDHADSPVREPKKGTAVFKGKGGKVFPDTEKSKTTKQVTNKGSIEIPNEKVVKDKSLIKGVPNKTKEFQQNIDISDEEFTSKNASNKIGPPPPPFKFPNNLIKDPKFPKRYLTVIERMMNTANNDSTKQWSYWSKLPGGAGQISAQAGEIMTMSAVTMSDDEFNKFINLLKVYEQEQVKVNPKFKDREGDRIITKDWLRSVENQRKVILRRIAKQYGSDAKIIGSCWDTAPEVTAMGLSNYKDNKGFSTDIYIKIKLADGKEVLDEPSLKKDKRVNLINSGTGDLVNSWNPKLKGTSVDPKVYAAKERKRLATEGADVLAKVAKSNPVLQKAIDALKKGGGSRQIAGVVYKSIAALADKGDKNAKAYVAKTQEIHRQMQQDVIKVLNTDKSARNGLINALKSECPIKSVADGEETMAIGDMSLDKFTMQELFGTTDFNSIRERLVVKTSSKGEPYLSYQVAAGKKEIPIGPMVIRQDGIGYGGSSIKFELKLGNEFANTLKLATEKVYGK